MSKVMTWDKSKDDKRRKNPDGSGSSKLRESFKRSKPTKPSKPDKPSKPSKPSKPKKRVGQRVLKKRNK